MVAVDSGLLMFGGVVGGGMPFAQDCWLLQLGPNPLLGLRENEVSPTLLPCKVDDQAVHPSSLSMH